MRASVWTAAITLAWIVVTGEARLAVARAAEVPGQRAEAEPAAEDKAGKEIHALRITGRFAAIRIDGRLDDEAWMQAQGIDDLVQEDPDNMKPPTEQTTVRIAYDDRYVYVAMEMLMQDVSQVREGLARRGSAPPSDRVYVGFDTAHDHQNAYMFEVNASGVQNDFLQVEDTRQNNDYEAVWEVVTARTSRGWVAEFRIPFSQMRFPAQPGDRTVWGFQVRRDIFVRGEEDWWIARPRGKQGIVSRFGHLIFDDRLSPPRRLEFTPYTLGQLRTKSNEAVAGTGNAGVDLRVGLGSSATLAATVNPDFGQVEADPSVLNLSVFETFFPEKRPFFVEDSQSLSNSNFSQFPDFYSRRIGNQPNHFKLADNETLVRKPDTTTILGAAKVTGRTSRWTYGGLTAMTSREYGAVDLKTSLVEGGEVLTRRRKLIEPRSVYSVGRVLRTMLGDTSSVGVIATSVAREKDLDSLTFGGDATVRRLENKLFMNAHWVGTHAPVEDQNKQVRIKNGLGGAANMFYNGKYSGGGIHYDRFDRAFHNTELGFLQSRTNKQNLGANVYLAQPDPHGIFRFVFANLYSGHDWTVTGLDISHGVGLFANARFTNFWNVFLNRGHNFAHYDDLETRGGPPVARAGGDYFHFGFGSDSRKQYGIGLRVETWRDGDGSRAASFYPDVRFQISTRLVSSIGTEYTSARDSAQWIKNLDTNGDKQDDQYVFGRLRRHVVSVTGRTTYSFTRDMTLEAYLQPFIAVGNYTNVGQLARAKTFEFTPVTLADNPDFNRKSVRGTIVLRWEYVRGSALFAVWNLATREEDLRKGIFSPWRDFGGAFGAPGTNTFALKLSYWFAP